MTNRGTLWGVGLGPGDPELVTVKAARVIGEADVVAYHSARHGRSIARGIAEPYLRPGQIEEHLVYPVTTETTDHPGGYAGAIEDFYVEATERIAATRSATSTSTTSGRPATSIPPIVALSTGTGRDGTRIAVSGPQKSRAAPRSGTIAGSPHAIASAIGRP